MRTSDIRGFRTGKNQCKEEIYLSFRETARGPCDWNRMNSEIITEGWGLK